MEIIKLFLLLLILHIIGDFYLQSQQMCDSKRKAGIKSKTMYTHLLILSFLFLPIAIYYNTFGWFILIILSHGIIDICKSYLERKYPQWALHYFFGDQLLHWTILAFCAMQISPLNSVLPINGDLVLLALGFLLLFKPTNILITLVLRQFNVTPRSEKTLPSAGHLIGNMERILTFILILLEQYSAVGFLIAAKSLLRFRDNKQTTISTEYVLCGTLLSIGCAFIISICIKHFNSILRIFT